MRRRVIEVIVVRHAIAFEPDPARWRDDRTRPLTAEGRKRFRKTAVGLGRLVETPNRVLTSPLVRAVETAAILEKAAGWPAAVPCPELEPNGTPARMLDRLRAERCTRIAIVGHEPLFSRFVGCCIAGARAGAAIELKKGGVAILQFKSQLKPGGATLIALLPPRASRSIRE